MKDKFKKIGLIVVLITIIVAIILVIINSSSGKKDQKTSNSFNSMLKAEVTDNNSTTLGNVQTDKSSVENRETKITKLNDGEKYSLSDENIKADIVIGDNYYGTQLNDINLNFNQYEGKTIEIEGLYIENNPYTFVGRYSTSVVCQDCPPGFSYFEFEWHGDKKLPVEEEKSWLKVIGTLKKGNDGVDYYYIDASEIEIMNEKGIDTVNN